MAPSSRIAGPLLTHHSSAFLSTFSWQDYVTFLIWGCLAQDYLFTLMWFPCPSSLSSSIGRTLLNTSSGLQITERARIFLLLSLQSVYWDFNRWGNWLRVVGHVDSSWTLETWGWWPWWCSVVSWLFWVRSSFLLQFLGEQCSMVLEHQHPRVQRGRSY